MTIIINGRPPMSETDFDTLAELNAIVSDATLDTDSAPRDPNAHDIGGASHTGEGDSVTKSVGTGSGDVAAGDAPAAAQAAAEAASTPAADGALNTTHRTSDGKDHSDVVLNNAARLSLIKQYLRPTQPAGAAAPELVYQHDGGVDHLSDRTANSHDLTVASGTATSGLQDEQKGLGAQSLHCTAPISAALNITGALTMEAVVVFDSIAGYQVIMQVGSGAGGNEIPYSLGMDTALDEVRYVHFSAGAVAREWLTKFKPSIGVPYYLCITRASNGVDLVLYVNGVEVNGTTVAAAPMTPGGSAQYNYCAGSGAVIPFVGTILSARVTAGEYTAAQVAEVWDALRAA
jgi:hypothetical protein